MMWNTPTPVFIIFIGFYSVRHSSDGEGRISVKVALSSHF